MGSSDRTLNESDRLYRSGGAMYKEMPKLISSAGVKKEKEKRTASLAVGTSSARPYTIIEQ